MTITKDDIKVIGIVLFVGLAIGFGVGRVSKKCKPCSLETIELPKDAKIITKDTPADSVLNEWNKRNGSN